jgi:hypothetical protein
VKLEDAFGPLLDELADRIVARLTAGVRADMVDQVASPLGRRRHCAAVRRRVANGEPGAAVVGRRHLLARDALAAELEAASKRRPRPKQAAPLEVDELADLRDRYGLQRTGT